MYHNSTYDVISGYPGDWLSPNLTWSGSPFLELLLVAINVEVSTVWQIACEKYQLAKQIAQNGRVVFARTGAQYSIHFHLGLETELPVLSRYLLAWVRRVSSFVRYGREDYCTQPPMRQCKVFPDSGIKEIFTCGIRFPVLRNQNLDLGIRNPTNNWNPKSKFYWQGPRIEYAIQNPIKTVLDYLTPQTRASTYDLSAR